VHLKKPLGRLDSLTILIVQRLLISDLVAAAKQAPTTSAR
jgi:hypothetical protein